MDIGRLKAYANFLEEEIKGQDGLIANESMLGSVAQEQVKKAYIEVRDKLYELFPEIMKTRTPIKDIFPYEPHFTIKVLEICRREDISEVEELVENSAQDFTESYGNIGPKTIDYIQRCLRRAGLDLAEEGN